jgi:hypothetical protein
VPSFRALSGKFFGNTVGIASGVAAGNASSRTLDPILQDLTNEAWSLHATVPPDVYALAQGVAQGQVDPKQAAKWAKEQGFDQPQFDALVNIANIGPALGYAYEAWRRGFLTDNEFQTALNRQGIEPQWFRALKQLKDQPISPEVAALAAVRGLIPDEGTLLVSPPTEPGKVPSYPQQPISGLAAAAATGLSPEAYKVLVGINGRPMPVVEAARATFRNVIERSDFDRAISEGDIRNEWRDALFEVAREILTAHDWVELHLRGYITAAEMYAGTALHGMSTEDTDRLYNVLGRPLTVHQITTGLARGGTFQPVPGELTDPYEASVHESNIKPAYYDLAIANKYTLPGYFVIKAMLTAGTITEAEGAQLFKEEGWPPDLAEKAAAALAPAGSTGKRLTQSQIHAAFKAGTMTEADALARLEQDGYSQADAQLLVNTWKA